MTDVDLGGVRRRAPEGEPTWRARARAREAAAAAIDADEFLDRLEYGDHHPALDGTDADGHDPEPPRWDPYGPDEHDPDPNGSDPHGLDRSVRDGHGRDGHGVDPYPIDRWAEREDHGLPRPTRIERSPDRGRTAVMDRPVESTPAPAFRAVPHRFGPTGEHRPYGGDDAGEQQLDAWFDGDEPSHRRAGGPEPDEWVEEIEVSVPARPGRTRGAGYKLGLVAMVGVSIWMVVTLLSPTTLVDTENLPDDAGLAAIDPDPNVQPEGFAAQDGSAIGSGEQTIEVGGATETTVAGDPAAGGTEAGADAEATTSTTEGSEAAAGATASLDYRSNLEMLQGATVRNRNHDNSPHLSTPSAQLTPSDHHGPRSEYLNNPGGNPEQAFPIPAGGQFRVACEFSHFAYDDPLIHPGKPGAAHLHMFFGNTHVNAFSTHDSLLNSGSSTCNGQELNRTGYWVPAMIDGQGNVRIPERIVIYYKGEGRSRGNTIPYPEGAAMVITDNLNDLPDAQGGAPGKTTFVCSDNFSSPSGEGGETMPACDGSKFKNLYGVDDNPRVVLEVNIKFPQCWNGQDPSNIDNFRPPQSSWYGSNCTGEFNQNLPNLEYFVNYPVAIGESTSDWFLSSDVDPTSFGATKATAGSTIHGDWWGGWHKETNQAWVDNCVNYADGSASGCGFGYLTNGGSNGGAPADGPALKMRPQYDGPIKVPAEQLLRELCPDPNKAYAKPEDAAYCAPGTGL